MKWWMAHYGAETAKRHWGASNSTAVSAIDKGVLQGWKKKSTKTPVVKYKDSKGVQRYKGTSDLRKTEKLGYCFSGSKVLGIYKILIVNCWVQPIIQLFKYLSCQHPHNHYF